MPSPKPTLLPAVISAPFGNYVQPDGATPTLGTFTAHARGGRVWRIVKTVRYYRRLRAWVNKIGLRNPGMPWLVQRAASGKVAVADRIVSVHGFTEPEWHTLLQQCVDAQVGAIELNMSCPNVGHIDWPESLFPAAAQTGLPVIVKLPPVNYHLMAERATDAGLTAFHCCNTLPVPAGGVSGKPLKPVALQCLHELKARYPDALFIGGGGIGAPADIDEYLDAGADHIALGTKTMNPLLLMTDRPIRGLIDHAASRLGA